ncbi:unnamed protein product, partial [Porites evermanni]
PDINECNVGKHSCDVTSSVCYNTKGSFACACKEGYFKDGEDKCTVSLISIIPFTSTDPRALFSCINNHFRVDSSFCLKTRRSAKPLVDMKINFKA